MTDGMRGDSKRDAQIQRILTEEINKLHRNGILLMFNILSDVTYILIRLNV
jgi:ethanolamine utilization cobalamin adenosyltransferase